MSGYTIASLEKYSNSINIVIINGGDIFSQLFIGQIILPGIVLSQREGVRWALMKLGVDEWLIRTFMALYTEACTVVRTDAGLSASVSLK